MPGCDGTEHIRPPASKFLAAFGVFSLIGTTSGARADTVLGFPKDAPAFTFELQDGMQAEYQSNGQLVCTPRDGSMLKGVLQALPNVANDNSARLGLTRLIRLVAPSFLTGDVQFPAIFNEDTPSGIHTLTASAFGNHDGKEAGLALIVFSKSGKYYELIVSGAVDEMKALNFPHTFRETMK